MQLFVLNILKPGPGSRSLKKFGLFLIILCRLRLMASADDLAPCHLQ